MDLNVNSRPNSVDSYCGQNSVNNPQLFAANQNHFYHHMSHVPSNAMSSAPMSLPMTSSTPHFSSEQHFSHNYYNNSIQMPFNSSSTTATTQQQPMSGNGFQMNNNSSSSSAMIPPQYNWSQNNDYLSQYYSQYYRDYYRRYVQQQQELRQQQQQHLASLSSGTTSATPQLRPPLKYGSHSCHSRAIFSQHNNCLIVLDNPSTTGPTTTTRQQTSRQLFVYSLNDLLVDYLFPKQLLLLKSDLNQLPFNSNEKCLKWIRSFLLDATTDDVNYELKLILKVIQTLLKQNSVVTGLDLSDLLLDLVDFESLNKQFETTTTTTTTTTSNYGNANNNNNNIIVNQLLNNYRILLMRGQRIVALNYALSNRLMDHALTLSYLMQTLDNNRKASVGGVGVGIGGNSGGDTDLMLTTIRKFIANSLLPSDPIHVLYNALLNAIQSRTGNGVQMELNFESFLMLLSNDLNLNSIEITRNDTNSSSNSQNVQTFTHLLRLIKSLMNSNNKESDDRRTTSTTTTTTTNDDNFVLSDDLFRSEMDSILINECLEFSRFSAKKFNPNLIQKKLTFITLLFDFGFISNALQYCQQLKTFSDLSENTRKVLFELESRFDPNLQFDQQFSDDRATPDDDHCINSETVVDHNNQSYETMPDVDDSDDTRQTRQSRQTNNTESVDSVSPIQDYVSSDPVPNSSQSNTQFDYYGQLMSSPLPPQSPSAANKAPLQPPIGLNNAIYSNNNNNNFDDNQSLSSLSTFSPIVSSNGFDANSEPFSTFSFVSTTTSTTTNPNDNYTNDVNDVMSDNNRVQFANNNSMSFGGGFGAESDLRNTIRDEKKSGNTSTGDNNSKNNKNSKSGNNISQSEKSSGLLSKLFNFRPKNQAILPDDTNMSLVYDKQTQQWIDKSEQNNTNGGQSMTPRAPPIGPPVLPPTVANGTNEPKKFEFKARSKQRYVDIMRQ